jgi:hypothetical protein
MNRITPLNSGFLLAILLCASGQIGAQAEAFCVQNAKAASGDQYLLIYQGDTIAHWTTTRPNKDDKKIVLCIPAAFTETFGGVDGLYAQGGHLFNKGRPDKKIGGALCVIAGKCSVIPCPGGNIDGGVIANVQSRKGDLFQQFQVVANGIGEKFKDASHVQRRGVAIFKDCTTAIVESVGPITLTQFGEDLAQMGAEQLAYTDMGPWDEGWYRDPVSDKLCSLGRDHSLTNRQSNWLYFEHSQTGARQAPSHPQRKR